MSTNSGDVFALSQRIATLEGKVDALCMLLGGQHISGPAPNVTAAETAAETTATAIPAEIHEAVKATARGNRALTRHLYSVALELLAAEVEPAAIVRKIRDGERV